MHIVLPFYPYGTESHYGLPVMTRAVLCIYTVEGSTINAFGSRLSFPLISAFHKLSIVLRDRWPSLHGPSVDGARSV